jgi:DNA repair photolyase
MTKSDTSAPQQPTEVPVAFQRQPVKGRGTTWDLPHRFHSDQREAYDDGWGTLDQQAQQEWLPPSTQVIEEQVKSINPYRGCEHGCIYCYARPTHSYLGLSPGLDFETRIVAKLNAAQRLREALSRPRYVAQQLNLGSATDAYQPVERALRITRGLVELLHDCQHPVSIITKSAGIERDLDLLAPMAQRHLAAAYVSLTTLDPLLARILEPRAASPQRRLRTISALSQAGVPVGVSVSPLIPFINEPELEHILAAAKAAGASRAFAIVLRLPWEVSPLFQRWLEQHFPDRAQRVMARVRDMRGGKDNDSQFGSRMTGHGVWAQLLRQRLHKACDRLGLSRERVALDLSRFRPPEAGPRSPPSRQASLF